MLISGDTQWVLSVGLICAAIALFAWGVYRRKYEVRDRELHELRLSHSKFRSLFENVTQGVYQSTPGGKLLSVNPALVRMFGYDSEDQFLKTSVRDLYTDSEDRDRHLRYLDSNGQLHDAEIRLRRKDGTPLVVIENSRAVRDENGELLYYEGTLTDITQHKRAQRREQDRNSVLELIARNEKLEDILQAVGGMVEHQFPKLMAAVDLIDEGRLFSASAPSLPPAFTAAIDGVATGHGAGSAGQAALLGHPVISADISADRIWAPFREIALKHDIRSAWSMPIMLSAGPVVG
ncbi:MAG: PAS domain S-box protein, partial [Acidobacteriota bacterium]|nr:PAS domain S-box protein [Acidobacteriota bacterium]